LGELYQSVIFANFIGPTYQSESPNADPEDCLNWYPELVESGAGKNKYVYYPTPGLSLFVTLPKTPIRGLWANDQQLFAVAGDHLYLINGNATYIDLGYVSTDGQPCDRAQNGIDSVIASAGWIWWNSGLTTSPAHFDVPWTDLAINGSNPAIVSSAAAPFGTGDVGIGIDITGGTGFTQGFYLVTAVDNSGNATLNSPAGTAGSTGGQAAQRVAGRQVQYLDGYYWAGPSGHSLGYVGGYSWPGPQSSAASLRQFNISSLLTGSDWDPLQYASKEGQSDNLLALLSDHEEMWLWGISESTEVWRNSGQVQPDFPFQRDSGGFIHMAIAAPWSRARVANGVAWLAKDSKRGGISAVYAQGYQPQRISTHAIENIWGGYSNTADAIAYSEELNGHQFYVVSFPTGNQTWAYDFTTQMWHRRGWWNGASVDRSRVAYQCYVALGNANTVSGALPPAYYGADWQNGNIYTVSAGNHTDNGTEIYRQRVAPYLNQEAYRVFHHRFQLDMQGSGTIPVTLDWSDDGGNTWSNQFTVAWSSTSAQRFGLVWRRMGQSRARIYRVTSTAAAQMALINAYLEVTPGVS